MRLLNYLSISGVDGKTNVFRALEIKLTEKENPSHTEIVKDVVEKYELSNEVLSLLENLNKELKSMYRGKYKFDFCLEEGKPVTKMKIKNSESLKKKIFNVNNMFSQQKTLLERKIAEKEK